jgi:hypothetical protein
LIKRLESLYEIRSDIVHSGRFQVSEFDLDEAREFARKALFIVSNEATFQEMADATELDKWLEDQVISSADDKAASNDGDAAGTNAGGQAVYSGLPSDRLQGPPKRPRSPGSNSTTYATRG